MTTIKRYNKKPETEDRLHIEFLSKKQDKYLKNLCIIDVRNVYEILKANQKRIDVFLWGFEDTYMKLHEKTPNQMVKKANQL